MVRCNLAVLLAERNLKISKVSAETGISRTTLTALSLNRSQGIQFDTLNTLCMYLQVTPSDIISAIPIDVDIASVILQGAPRLLGEDEDDTSQVSYYAEICFRISDYRGTKAYVLKAQCDAEESWDDYGKLMWDIYDMYFIQDSISYDVNDMFALIDILNNLPATFCRDVEKTLMEILKEQFETATKRPIALHDINLENLSIDKNEQSISLMRKGAKRR